MAAFVIGSHKCMYLRHVRVCARVCVVCACVLRAMQIWIYMYIYIVKYIEIDKYM